MFQFSAKVSRLPEDTFYVVGLKLNQALNQPCRLKLASRRAGFNVALVPGKGSLRNTQNNSGLQRENSGIINR